MKENKDISRARDFAYLITIREDLNAVSSYAYGRNCYGLTDSECRMLEELCDASEKAIIEQIANYMKGESHES